MSVTDDVRAEARPPAGAPPGAQGQQGSFEKTPPQDNAAEQCVLGGMLLSKDAIADVVEILRSADFYRPVHATIFDAILDIYGRGEPADAITVAAALADSGDLGRVGGASYLHDLVSMVPTAANAAYYARIVSERAVLRRLVEAGTRIVQLGYGMAAGAGRDVDDIVDLAQQAVYDVTERRISEDFAVLADMLQPTLDEIEAVGAQSGVMTGVPTGFTDLDRLLNGLHPGQLVVVAGRPGLGKALALDTPLPTPDGWTTMGQVKVGDQVLGADGHPTTITRAFDVMRGRPCYEVVFSDGSTIVADVDHLWKTTTRASRRQQAEIKRSPQCSREAGLAAIVASAETTATRPGTVTTAEIAATVRHPTDGRLNHAVENCRPLSLPHREDLPVPAYTLGVWLGDGHSNAARFTTADYEIVTHIETDGFIVRRSGPLVYSILTPDLDSLVDRDCVVHGERFAPRHRRYGSFMGYLRAAGVVGGKHIPAAYLRGSEAQRRALLAGLLDTDGTVTATGSVQYCSTSRKLAEDVYELVVSLGYRCTIVGKLVKGRTGASPVAYTLNFSTMDDVFRLERKRLAQKERSRARNNTRTGSRFIVDVRPVPSVPVRCITVDNADHMYLAGRSMIPTHNSTASMDFARTAAVKHNLASAIFSLEMSKVEIVMRLLSAEARVPLHVLRSGQLSDDDWTKLARRMGEISEAPLFVDDTPNMNLMEIRAKARRLKQRHDLKLIVVDYLQLMTSPKRVESRQQEVADLSRGLKLLAKEVECPVVAVSQLNRGPEQRTDKRPQLSDLRESGCLTAGTRVVRADTNEEVTLGRLLADGATEVPVWALDERLKYQPRTLTHVFPSGRREVFRLRLASGKEVEATANHPFLTFDGWTCLGALAPGDRVATPRHLPPPLRTSSRPDEEVARLAGRQPPDKPLPAAVFALPKRQVALFLRHLWATGGSVTVVGAGSAGRICLGSASRRLLEDVSRLLLRFGVTARLGSVGPGAVRPGMVTAARHRSPYTLDIPDREDQLRFLREIGAYGAWVPAGDRLLTVLEQANSSTTVDTIPRDVWGRVREILTGQSPGRRPSAAITTGSRHQPVPGRQRLARIAAVLDSAELDLHATNDVCWDEVVAVEPLGVQDVYDATVPGLHNFVANGIAVHNSIEQDADVVILLHRDDYYDKESPRAGEADFIVAKHRNGPTDTVTVAAQLHLSRFVDMAIV